MIIGLATAILTATLFGHAAEGFKGIDVFQIIANDIVENKSQNFKKIGRWDLIERNVVELANKAKRIGELMANNKQKESDAVDESPFHVFSKLEDKEYMKTIRKLSVEDREKFNQNARVMKKLMEELLNMIQHVIENCREDMKSQKCREANDTLDNFRPQYLEDGNDIIGQLPLEVVAYPELIQLVQQLEKGKTKLDDLVQIPRTISNGIPGNLVGKFCNLIREAIPYTKLESKDKGIKELYTKYADHLSSTCSTLQRLENISPQSVQALESAIKQQALHLLDVPEVRDGSEIEQIRKEIRESRLSIPSNRGQEDHLESSLNSHDNHETPESTNLQEGDQNQTPTQQSTSPNISTEDHNIPVTTKTVVETLSEQDSNKNLEGDQDLNLVNTPNSTRTDSSQPSSESSPSNVTGENESNRLQTSDRSKVEPANNTDQMAKDSTDPVRINSDESKASNQPGDSPTEHKPPNTEKGSSRSSSKSAIDIESENSKNDTNVTSNQPKELLNSNVNNDSEDASTDSKRSSEIQEQSTSERNQSQNIPNGTPQTTPELEIQADNPNSTTNPLDQKSSNDVNNINESTS